MENGRLNPTKPGYILKVAALIFLLPAAIFIVDCNTPPEPDPGPPIDETVETSVGDTFTLSLGANPSTGYAWEAEYDTDFLELVKKSYVSEPLPGPKVVGYPGTETFEFKALKQGRIRITMTYKRSWEADFQDQYIVLVKID